MEFEVKFYRLHDLDIVGLRDLGYPVQAMLMVIQFITL